MNLFNNDFFSNIGVPTVSEPVEPIDLVDSMNKLSIASSSKPVPFVHSRNIIIQNKSGNQKNDRGQSGRITNYTDATFLIKVIEEIFILFKDLPKQQLNSDPFTLFEKTIFNQVVDNKIKKISLDQNTKCKILEYIPSIFTIKTKEKRIIEIPFNNILQVAFLGKSKDKLGLITSLEPLKASIFKFDYTSPETEAAIKKQDYLKFQESVLNELSKRIKSEPLDSIFGDYKKLVSSEIDSNTVCFSFVYGDKKLLGEYGSLKDSTLPQWKIAVDRGQKFFNEKDLNFDSKDFVLIKIGDLAGKYGKLIEKTEAFANVLLENSGRRINVLEKDLFHKDLEYNGKYGQIIKYMGDDVLVSMKTETGISEQTISIKDVQIFTENVNINKKYDTDYISETLDEEKDIDSDNESVQSDKSETENLAFQADHDSDYQEETEMKTSHGDSYDREIQNLSKKQKENKLLLEKVLISLALTSHDIEFFEIINGMESVYKQFSDEFSNETISETIDGKIVKLAFIFSKLLKFNSIISIDLEYTGTRRFGIDYYLYKLQKSKLISSRNLNTGILIKDNPDFKFKELKGKTEFGDYRILFNNAFIFLENEFKILEVQTKVQDLPDLVTLTKPIQIHNIPNMVVFSQLTDDLLIIPGQFIMWNKKETEIIDKYIIYLENEKEKAQLKNKNLEKYDYMIQNIRNIFFVIKSLQSKNDLTKHDTKNLKNLLNLQKVIFETIKKSEV